MFRVESLHCPYCGIVEHTITETRQVCTSCGAVNEIGERGDCRFDICPRSATHLVVYNPVGQQRRSEYYCEEHAEHAASEAKRDEAGDLFLGPEPIE